MRYLILALLLVSLLVILASCASKQSEEPAQAANEEDPYLWLEEIDGEEALAWVKERSAKDQAVLEAVPEFQPIHEKLLEIYNSKDRLIYPGVRGEMVYNFWQDAEHVRGLWRRTTIDDYLQDEPTWETVMDLDAIAEAEGENWVWKGAQGLYPDYKLFLVTLSRGGGDASVVREFDAEKKAFVEGGFHVPEAKSRISWKDENTLWLGTDFGDGSLTTSGYPRIVKLWKRGTDMAEAETVFEGEMDDMSVGAYTNFTPDGNYDVVYRIPEFFKGEYWQYKNGDLTKVDIPIDAEPSGIFKKQFMVSLRSDWTVGGKTYPSDALLSIDFEAFMGGDRNFQTIFEPGERVALDGRATTLNYLLYSTMDNVKSRIYRCEFKGGQWHQEEIELPGLGNAGVFGTSDVNDNFFVNYTDFLTPSTIYLVRDGKTLELAKQSPEYFDTTGMTVAQHEAVSKDGTRIPYFLVMPKGYQADGKNPTLLYGYGGFEVSMQPQYSATVGTAWAERGGVYALANIRGGGEFGPKWHQAAMQENHQNNFDDFIAVAEDLIERKVTTPRHLGIAGGSQGGLLVGGTFTQRPDLFEAVVCQVPLLDMKRYNKLLAGASWMAEYGNPDTEDWDNYMKSWSPYQNVHEDKEYPEVFFFTSTRDDRVHPGHARKMVKKMTDMGHKVYYYENTEGGHGGAANLNQRAYMWGITYAYLWKMLR
jgi:prolyl oligopeptidase